MTWKSPKKIAQMKTKFVETNELKSRQDVRMGWHGNQILKDKLNEIRIILDDKTCVIRLDKMYHDNFRLLEELTKEFCRVL